MIRRQHSLREFSLWIEGNAVGNFRVSLCVVLNGYVVHKIGLSERAPWWL